MGMNKQKKFFCSLLLGSVIGFINGFFGGGGGMIVVPVLTKFYKLPQKKAHATSIAIILPITVASAIIYLLTKEPSWQTFGSVAGGVALGGTVGALLLNKISNRVLEYLFEGVMLVAGIKMLFF